MKITSGDPNLSHVRITFNGKLLGHLLEADDEEGYVVQQLPEQDPVLMEGVVKFVNLVPHCFCTLDSLCDVHQKNCDQVSVLERQAVVKYLALDGDVAEAILRGDHLMSIEPS